MASAPLLNLPFELSSKIYEYILAFEAPIKLRQFVPGSEKTTLLRVNRQVYNEALAVLFDVNTVAITRNDLCTRTGPSLRTPVPGKYVRHLLVSNFGESIACNILSDRCAVCEHDAVGFFDALRTMPQLRTVVVDYHMHMAKFRHFRETLPMFHDKTAKLWCSRVGIYSWTCTSMANVDLTFQHRPLACAWPALIALSRDDPSMPEEDDALNALRKMYGDIVDKLWLLMCARKVGFLPEIASQVADTWLDSAKTDSTDVECISDRLHAFTQALQAFTDGAWASQCRQNLIALRQNALF